VDPAGSNSKVGLESPPPKGPGFLSNVRHLYAIEILLQKR